MSKAISPYNNSPYDHPTLLEIAGKAITADLMGVRSMIRACSTKATRQGYKTGNGTYIQAMNKLDEWITGGATVRSAPYNLLTITAKAGAPCWSIAPVVSCAGAGACKNYCYSLKAWRNPCAYARQIQNTIIAALAVKLGNRREDFIRAIVKLADMHAKRGYKHIRIHVDGDMFNIEYLKIWTEIAQECTDTVFYAYTKAFEVFKGYGDLYGEITMPDNLTVRLSSDHKYSDASLIRYMEHIHTTVGYFHTYTHANARDARVCGYMAECEGGCKACNYKCASRTIGDIWVEIH